MFHGKIILVWLLKVVSGGQTGVDRAALDVARAAGIETGGWCPRGRRAADGAISMRYPLKETPTGEYAQRTEWNVRDSGATLILHRGSLNGGTHLTAELARQYARPLFLADLGESPDAAEVRGWLAEEAIQVLNVAGPREEYAPGIRGEAIAFLTRLFG